MSGLRVFLWVLLVCAAGFAESATDPNDVRVMQELAKSLDPAGTLGWKSGDPCSDWDSVRCAENRVTVIKIGGRSLRGSLPADFRNLTGLTSLELQNNGITGPLPSFSGMNNLQVAILHNNSFSSIQPDFFSGLTQLQAVYLDHNPFSPWSIPTSLGDATNLVNFSANAANITGMIPDFVGTAFSGLLSFSLAYNSLSGGIPASFAGSNLQILWLNNQQGSRLSGGIDLLANMTYLVQVWLQSNEFTGPIPDFSGLKSLRELNLRDNLLTGPAPQTLIDHPTLTSLMITDNKLQGRLPVFPARMTVDNIVELNSYCLPTPGNCDPRVDVLLSCVESLNYPEKLAESWKGNDPCDGWVGITCNPAKNVTLVNFEGQHFSGTISPNFGKVLFLEKLLLSNNNLTGHIPSELTTLANLKEIDVTNNSLSGKIPNFRQNVLVTAGGNPQLVKDDNTPSSPGTPSASGGLSGRGSSRDEQSLSGGAISGIVIAGLFIVGCSLCGFFLYKKRNGKRFGRVQSPNLVVHPRNSGSDRDFVKITVAGAGNVSTDLQSQTSSQFGDLQVVESGNMVISIQVLREVTNNFSKENVLGSGGFGTVYKGELPDGTQIAVKRMEGGIVSSKGLDEFKSEIAVLTNVRHRNLVSLHGYCFDGNERLLVYEYMPQGSLSKHLFDWKEDRRKPMQWKTRLSVALDVARGVEYLHSLARQSFIHRDLKPSNVLLGDDMRAKVSDFGLVRLAPSGPGHSIETKLAGTFGYLAPEYAVTGRVTIKVDVYSYGVVLMELITGRKAMDETKPEDSQHLVPWFRRMNLNKEIFKTAIDPSLELSEETLSSIYIVAELAGHCCAREPYQRPDMGHVVNVLSPLVELWKPSAADPEDCCGIDLDIPLPQALKKWQADTESNDTDSSTSNSSASMDNTQTSIATRPSGFAESFTSADGR